MRTLYRFLRKWIVALLQITATYAIHFGLVFTATLIGATIVGWGFDVRAVQALAVYGWAGYALLGAFTLLSMATNQYLLCCAWGQSLRKHLSHLHQTEFGKYALYTALWPAYWCLEEAHQRNWGGRFSNTIMATTKYWFKSSVRRRFRRQIH